MVNLHGAPVLSAAKTSASSAPPGRYAGDSRERLKMIRWAGRIIVYLVAVWLAIVLQEAVGRFDPEPEATTTLGIVLVFVLSMLLQIGFLISPEAVHKGRAIRLFCFVAMLPIWIMLALLTIGAVGEALTTEASQWLPFLPAAVGFVCYTACSILMILPGSMDRRLTGVPEPQQGTRDVPTGL